MSFPFHGGVYIPGKVISRNKRKKTAFVSFFSAAGVNKEKQLVSTDDIRSFEKNFDEYVISEHQNIRDIYLVATS